MQASLHKLPWFGGLCIFVTTPFQHCVVLEVGNCRIEPSFGRGGNLDGNKVDRYKRIYPFLRDKLAIFSSSDISDNPCRVRKMQRQLSGCPTAAMLL